MDREYLDENVWIGGDSENYWVGIDSEGDVSFIYSQDLDDMIKILQQARKLLAERGAPMRAVIGGAFKGERTG
jgi:hypothetical protein